jgi:excisionase family DNA binding protein
VFSIELTFRIDGREVTSERFALLFVKQALREAINDVLSGLASAGSLVSRPSPPTPQLRSEPRAVSVKEAARLLGLSPRTVQNLIGERKLACARFGKRVLIPMKAIDEALRRATTVR